MKKAMVMAALVTGLILLSGCASKVQGTPSVSEAQARQIAENVLQAISDNDYKAFIEDFSESMIAAFPESEFTKPKHLISTSSGKFISIDSSQLTNANTPDYVADIYSFKYEKENVKLTLIYKIGGDKVDGLFFDSANIRKNSK